MIRKITSFQNDDDLNDYQENMEINRMMKTEISQQLRRPIAFLGMSHGVFNMGDKLGTIRFMDKNGEVMEDELDQIHRRIESGYGLNSQDNLRLFQKKVKKIEQEIEFDNDDFNLFTELHDFWEWIQKCINYKKEQNNNNLQGGFKWKNMVDPSSGFKNIIEVEKEQNILPKPNNYLIFGHHVCETDKRIQALNICGWQELYVLQNNRYENQQNSPEKKLTAYLDRLVQDGQMSKAVAIAVFHFDFSKAYEYLIKINGDYDPHALSFMKYILKGLNNIQSILEKDQNLKNLFYQKKDNKQSEVQISRTTDCKSDWEILKKVNIFDDSFQTDFLDKLQEKQINIQFSYFLSNIMPFIKSMCSSTNFRDPYFKAICNFISNNQNPILYELRIPLFDRLAFAIRFYDSKKLETLFQNYEEASKSKGILGSLILTGQSQSSVEILQKYLDIKSDIQTVGLASVYLRIFKVIGEKKQQEWYSNYQGLLNRLRLFGERVKLDKQYSRLMETFLPNEGKLKDSLQNPFVIQKCNFCQCKNHHQRVTNKPYMNSFQPLQSKVESTLEKALLFNCQKCHKPFPNCATCLLPTNVSNPFLENSNNHELEESVIWCQNCKHGGHYRHIVEWFKEYHICPVSDCICECALL